MKIAESLKRFRLHFGYNQAEIAEKIGTFQQTYYKYETGKNIPSAEVIKKIAVAFNVSTDYLLGLSDTPSYDADKAILDAAIEFNQAVNRVLNRR